MSARSLGDVALGMVERKASPVHRHSFDVDDPRAKVFSKRVLDGSKEQGFAFIRAAKEVLKAEIKQHRAEGYRGPDRLQWIDQPIYEAILSFLDFATGALFPSHETIATKAGVCRQTVINSLRRLQSHGLILWVRRSVRTDDDDGPPRKQTSCAYGFDFRNRSAKRIWQTFVMALTRNLRKLGSTPAGVENTPAAPCDPALELALNSLGTSGEQMWSLSP